MTLFLQLVVIRADLNGHLKALKDYFLLAKGDFFQVKNALYLFLEFCIYLLPNPSFKITARVCFCDKRIPHFPYFCSVKERNPAFLPLPLEIGVLSIEGEHFIFNPCPHARSGCMESLANISDLCI